MARRKQPEGALQKAVAQLLDSLGWMWCHPIGEAYLHGTKEQRYAQMNRLKAQGFKNGEPDVMVYERWCECPPLPERYNKHYCGTGGFGVAIELKAGRNKATYTQEQWLADLRERGWLTAVCYSMDEVMDVLRHVRPLNGRRLQ